MRRGTVRAEIRRRRRVVDNDYAILSLQRKHRAVRITVVTKKGRHQGRPSLATFGFVDLDDTSIDRLIQRLNAVRGGKRALP